MPLPCELPLSGSSSNPVSLPGAIAALSAQVTSTMLEVRQEIGELKCEIVETRNLSLQLATSLINEQLQTIKSRLRLDFALLDLEVRHRESLMILTTNYQEAICGLAAGIIRSQANIMSSRNR